MNLTRCKNGHFYDSEKFSACPHCAQVQPGSSDETESVYGFKKAKAPDDNNIGFGGYGEDVTVPVQPFNMNRPAASKVTVDETVPLPKAAPPAAEGQHMVKVEKVDVDQDINIIKLNSDSLQEQVNAANTVPSYPASDDEKTVAFNYNYFPVRKSSPVVGWLVCVRGGSIGTSFELYSGKNFIGRGNDMDVIIPDDKSVSRSRHAVVIYDPKSKVFLVEPGMSRELFYLDDQLVLAPQLIESHQVLTIGNTDLMFVPLCGKEFDWAEQISKNEGNE